MQKYDSNNNETFQSFSFEDFKWENMTAQSDPKCKTVLMNVSHSYLNDVLDTNGSITIKVRAGDNCALHQLERFLPNYFYKPIILYAIFLYSRTSVIRHPMVPGKYADQEGVLDKRFLKYSGAMP